MQVRLRTLPPLLCAPLLLAALAHADHPPEQRLITVSGTATVYVVPDRVVITVGIENIDKDIHKALAGVNASVLRALEIAEKHGIEKRHIGTDYVGIEPHYEYRNNQTVYVGHKARQVVALTLLDIAGYESLVTDLLKAGVNRIHDVDFQTTELRSYKDQVRVQAMQAAREKAAAMAAAAKEALARVHSITEQQSAAWSTFGSWWRSSPGPNSNMYWEAPVRQAIDAGAIAPGQIAVTASVSVSFELK